MFTHLILSCYSFACVLCQLVLDAWKAIADSWSAPKLVPVKVSTRTPLR